MGLVKKQTYVLGPIYLTSIHPFGFLGCTIHNWHKHYFSRKGIHSMHAKKSLIIVLICQWNYGIQWSNSWQTENWKTDKSDIGIFIQEGKSKDQWHDWSGKLENGIVFVKNTYYLAWKFTASRIYLGCDQFQIF